jgi:2-haloacid dehalogenase
MPQTNAPWMCRKPSVLVFDVNETLIDIESINPLFERVFGDKRVMREWFGHLVMYSMTITLSGLYKDFWTLGAGVFQMVGAIHNVAIKPEDVEPLKNAMKTMPAHSDCDEGLTMLKDAGFRMVTLTNSPPTPGGKSPLENAGLDHSTSRTPAAISQTRLVIIWWRRNSTWRRPIVAWSRHTSGTRSAVRASAWLAL